MCQEKSILLVVVGWLVLQPPESRTPEVERTSGPIWFQGFVCASRSLIFFLRSSSCWRLACKSATSDFNFAWPA